jgi:hypothetical protein
MKTLTFKTADVLYSIPLINIDRCRSNSICETNGYEKDSLEYKDAFKQHLNDVYDHIDWIINNTDFEYWKSVLFRFVDKSVTIDKEIWYNKENFSIVPTSAYRLMQNGVYGSFGEQNPLKVVKNSIYGTFKDEFKF